MSNHARLSLIVAAAALSACATPTAAPEPAPEAEPVAAPAPEKAAPALTDGALVIQSTAGPIKITPKYHATTVIEADGKTIWLDPWSKANYDTVIPADIVLLTDVHFDHKDPEALAKVLKPESVIVAPAAVKAELTDLTVQHVLANGESTTLGGLTIEAVPMYNLTRGPDEGGVFHEKGRGNGYLIKYGGQTIYFAGDTECTPEMKALTGIDVAFIPMNLPYTMPVDEAAACVADFKPGVVVPYHYAGSDVAAFQAAVAAPTQVMLLDFYPGGLPW